MNPNEILAAFYGMNDFVELLYANLVASGHYIDRKEIDYMLPSRFRQFRLSMRHKERQWRREINAKRHSA